MRVVFDTNILIDALNGQTLGLETLKKYPHRLISRITWMEILVGAKDDAETLLLSGFLQNFTIIDTSEALARQAVRLKRLYRLRLPDAIIWATAKEQQALLITRDDKDFPANEPDILVPYRLSQFPLPKR